MANNPKHKENLKPFKKGDDERRNLEGRPKKLPELEKMLRDILGAEEDENSEAYQVLKSLVKEAKNGNTRAAEILLDRAYGKVKQTADVTSNGETIGAKEIVIKYVECTTPLANSEDAVNTDTEH